MTRHVKRGGKIWIRLFPDKPITRKPAETRMGSGKGAPDHWVAVVKPGRVLYEIVGVDESLGTRGNEPCGAETADQDEICLACRPRRRHCLEMKRKEQLDQLKDMNADELNGTGRSSEGIAFPA